MMQSCIGGEALGGGPILLVGIKCHVRIRGPATSDRQFGNRGPAAAIVARRAAASPSRRSRLLAQSSNIPIDTRAIAATPKGYRVLPTVVVLIVAHGQD